MTASATTVAYHLRPNKSIEREIFLDLLATMNPVLRLADYRYIGLGGPFLEDFRLIHKRIGVKSLVCIERDEQTHLRQLFNRTTPNIECLHGSVEGLLTSLELDEAPSIIWLDYSDSKNLQGKLQCFADLVNICPEGTVLKLTLGASVPKEADSSQGSRYQKARDKLGHFFPADAKEAEMTEQAFGNVLHRAIEIALSREKPHNGVCLLKLSSFLYADGVPILTVTGVIIREGERDKFLEKTQVENWEHFNSSWGSPPIIDVPILSLVEQRAVSLKRGDASPFDPIDFSLPEGKFGQDLIENFERYARIYPHFARVEL